VDDANAALVRIENQALVLVGEQRQAQAWELLNREEYQRSKATYADGLEAFSRRLQEHAESAIQDARREATRFLVAAMVLGSIVALILLLGCFSLLRALRSRATAAG
jgi:hypothetical protein